jgi:hypothetical protein
VRYENDIRYNVPGAMEVDVDMMKRDSIIASNGSDGLTMISSTVMKKPYESLKVRSQKKYATEISDKITAIWDQIAPGQDENSLRKCLNDGKLNLNLTSTVLNAVRAAYALACEKGDNRLKKQPLSMLVLQPDMNRTKASEILGATSTITGVIYREAELHASTCGNGMIVERRDYPRNVRHKISILDSLLEYLTNQGKSFSHFFNSGLHLALLFATQK